MYKNDGSVLKVRTGKNDNEESVDNARGQNPDHKDKEGDRSRRSDKNLT